MLATRAHVAQWYNKQFKTAHKLTLGTAAVAIIGSALLDVAVPYALTAIIGNVFIHEVTFWDFVNPLTWYLLCIGLGCVLHPTRQQLRRLVQDVGETRFLSKLEGLILLRPRLSNRTNRTSFMAAVEKFFSTWDRYVVVIFDQITSLFVGLGGMLILLAFVAPLLIPPVLVMSVLTLVYARKVSKVVSTKWSVYMKLATEEYSLISDQAGNSHIRWVFDALANERQKVSPLRSAALRVYTDGMKRYQTAMVLISKGFQVSCVVWGVVALTILHVPPGHALLSLVYGVSLSGMMANIFAVTDLLGTSLAEAMPLVEALSDTESESLGIELPAGIPARVEYRDVVVHREVRDDKTGDVVAIVDVPVRPDMILTPKGSESSVGPDDAGKPGNIYWFRGPKGSGKTSATEALCGLHRYSGSITIGGLEVRSHNVRDYVMNGPQSLDSLGRPAKMLVGGDTPDEVVLKQVLCWAGYTDAPLDRPLEARSGGEVQSLLRAGLFYEAYQAGNEEKGAEAPGILLIDEPTNHLDPKSINAMLTGISELAFRLPNRLFLVNSHCPDMRKIVRGSNIINLGQAEKV